MTSKEGLYKLAEKRGWKVIEELPDNYKESTAFYCEDEKGYRYRTCSNNLYMKNSSPLVHKTNKYSLYNIQHFLDLQCIPFTLLDTEYVSNSTLMLYECNRCKTKISTKWSNINRFTPTGRKGRMLCPKCDGTYESLHAVALKQMFKHKYPDTITEERSCINPDTNHAMPTDIVNHRLKIAIEIQSQWHDYRVDKDKIKRNYWVGRGYKFYAPDIRDYTILEMLQLFFDVDNIPEFIDFSQANKLNLHKIQSMLDECISPQSISNTLKISVHRIYDAINHGDLHYSDDYINSCYSPVVCFDMSMNKIDTYKSIAEASLALNVKSNLVASALYRNANYSQGYYWQRISDYNEGKELMPTKLKCYKKP